MRQKKPNCVKQLGQSLIYSECRGWCDADSDGKSEGLSQGRLDWMIFLFQRDGGARSSDEG